MILTQEERDSLLVIMAELLAEMAQAAPSSLQVDNMDNIGMRLDARLRKVMSRVREPLTAFRMPQV